MTLRNIIAAVAITGMVMAAGMPATAGDANKTKKTQTATAVKKSESTQGTFAYRYDTFTQYSTGGAKVCSSTDPTCTQSMNTDLRSGSSTLFPSVRKPDGKKANSSNTNTTVVTPAND